MKIYLDKNSFSKTTVFSGFISRFETNMLMKNTEIDLVSRICDTWGKEELGGEREKEGSRKSPETMVCRGQEKRQKKEFISTSEGKILMEYSYSLKISID